MNIILLSGGSGKRLWPLSNDIRSKQFIKIFRNDDGTYESMIQRVYNQIKKVDNNAIITIATNNTQVPAIYNQLSENIDLSIEPCRKDTFPAIVLATTYLMDVMNINVDEDVIVCPIDSYVGDDFYEKLIELVKLLNDGETNLALMGIEPTYPSEKYGYIIPNCNDSVAKVDYFVEKPKVADAKKYISQGALWNGGIFAYKLNYVVQRAHELLEFTDYYDLFDKYETLKKISFDYAVAEHEKNIKVLRFKGQWKDVGTWNTLTEVMEEKVVGNGILNRECENVNILNELDIPILAMGLQDIVIAASYDGILVSDKENSSYIKKFLDNFEQEIRFAEESWGSYKIVYMERGCRITNVYLDIDCTMSYRGSNENDEIWVVIKGMGQVKKNGKCRIVKAGDVIKINVGLCYTVTATTELKFTSIQYKSNIESY